MVDSPTPVPCPLCRTHAARFALAKNGYDIFRCAACGFLFVEPYPGEDEIRRFCSQNYDVTFPMFAKIEVNGPGTHPLYQYLKRQQPGILGSEAIKWNFTKFLVDRHGQVRKRYGSVDKPDSIEPDVAALLG